MLSRTQQEEIMKQAQGLLGQKIVDWKVLSGGLINHVFRAHTETNSVIVKFTPPYIASMPDISLCESRSLFEQQALRDIPTFLHDPHTPLLLADQRGMSIVEDKGALPSLMDCFSLDIVSRVGSWLANLHNATIDLPQYKYWNNIAIQESRRRNQYEALAHKDIFPEQLKQRLLGLGTQLCEQGICCIMGDLWPPSILIDSDNFWVIDWEFSHYGRPLQDVAHLCAHLDLQASQGVISPKSKTIFLESYLSLAKEKLHDDIFSSWASVHYAAEILMRIQGIFAKQEQNSMLLAHAIQMGTSINSRLWMEPIGE